MKASGGVFEPGDDIYRLYMQLPLIGLCPAFEYQADLLIHLPHFYKGPDTGKINVVPFSPSHLHKYFLLDDYFPLKKIGEQIVSVADAVNEKIQWCTL